MCDSMVTVTDAGLLFAKNSDRDPNEAQAPEWHPAADHAAGEGLSCTWIDIPQVRHTHAVLVSRPWWMWGAEMGANEHGVVIGNEAVFTKRPAPTGRRREKGSGRGRDAEPIQDGSERGTGSRHKALLGMDLVRLALERAASAEGAVSVIVELLERHGQGGPCSIDHPAFSYDNSFLVADGGAAFVVETAGRASATERVTGAGRSISNGFTIADFARVHADPVRTWVARAAIRRRTTQSLACRARGPRDLMTALRIHSSGRPRWSPVHGGLGDPCVHAGGLLTSSQSTSSWVSDLRGPERHWVTATSAPCTSLFKPVTVDEPIELGAAPTGTFDRRAYWWRHELLHRLTMVSHTTLAGRFTPARDGVELAWTEDPPSSAEAFAEGERLERAWLADVVGVVGVVGGRDRPGIADDRPGWVRRAWDRLDAACGFEFELASAGLDSGATGAPRRAPVTR